MCHALFGWLEKRHAAAFWIICGGRTAQAGRPDEGITVFKARDNQGLYQALGLHVVGLGTA